MAENEQAIDIDGKLTIMSIKPDSHQRARRSDGDADKARTTSPNKTDNIK